MRDDEFKVEVELGDEAHHLSFWDRLRSLDVDDDGPPAAGQPGDGDPRRQPDSAVHAAACGMPRKPSAPSRELVLADDTHRGVHGEPVGRLAQQWVDVGDGHAVDDDAPDVPVPDPSYVILEAYKPEFLRDLGLVGPRLCARPASRET